MMTMLLIFSDHYDVCCKWRNARFWTICECVDFAEIVWC